MLELAARKARTWLLRRRLRLLRISLLAVDAAEEGVAQHAQSRVDRLSAVDVVVHELNVVVVAGTGRQQWLLVGRAAVGEGGRIVAVGMRLLQLLLLHGWPARLDALHSEAVAAAALVVEFVVVIVVGLYGVLGQRSGSRVEG